MRVTASMLPAWFNYGSQQSPPTIAVGRLVGAHKLGAERGCEVFPLARAQPDGHLEALQVARAPVVHDRESRDAVERAIGGGKVTSRLADHAGQFQLVIERLAVAGTPDVGLVADDAGGAREIEDGHAVPLGHHVEPAVAPACRHVLLEGVEVADAGDLGERASHAFPRACARVSCHALMRTCVRIRYCTPAALVEIPELPRPYGVVGGSRSATAILPTSRPPRKRDTEAVSLRILGAGYRPPRPCWGPGPS